MYPAHSEGLERLAQPLCAGTGVQGSGKENRRATPFRMVLAQPEWLPCVTKPGCCPWSSVASPCSPSVAFGDNEATALRRVMERAEADSAPAAAWTSRSPEEPNFVSVGESQDPAPADQCSLSSGNGFPQPPSITCHLLGSARAGRFIARPCRGSVPSGEGGGECGLRCRGAQRALCSGLSRVIRFCKKQCLAALCLEPAN